MSTELERTRIALQEHMDSLRCAHEALHWLGRVRAYIDVADCSGSNRLVLLIELFAVAEACAELHAAGPSTAITMDDVREMLGWDATGADRLIDTAMNRLFKDGFISGMGDKPAKLVL